MTVANTAKTYTAITFGECANFPTQDLIKIYRETTKIALNITDSGIPNF